MTYCIYYVDPYREYLWKFFYPPDYQPLVPTEYPGPGQSRMWKSFDFKMSMQQDASFDVLFTKNKVRFLCENWNYTLILWVVQELLFFFHCCCIKLLFYYILCGFWCYFTIKKWNFVFIIIKRKIEFSQPFFLRICYVVVKHDLCTCKIHVKLWRLCTYLQYRRHFLFEWIIKFMKQ